MSLASVITVLWLEGDKCDELQWDFISSQPLKLQLVTFGSKLHENGRN